MAQCGRKQIAAFHHYLHTWCMSDLFTHHHIQICVLFKQISQVAYDITKAFLLLRAAAVAVAGCHWFDVFDHDTWRPWYYVELNRKWL